MAKECKYYKQKKQVSYDNGVTWQDVIPYQYQKGVLYEQQSQDCGYVPPTPTGKKLVVYTGGATREVECNENSTLTSGETQPIGYDRNTIINAVIGDCVTSIGSYAFGDCSGLTSINISNSVTNIGNLVFYRCSGLTRVNSSIDGVCNIPTGVTTIGNIAFYRLISLTKINIPDSVTSIGENAFGGCDRLASITINTTTPPSLGNWVFDMTNDCPIYVPAASVNAYKSATNWSNYASRIYPIP